MTWSIRLITLFSTFLTVSISFAARPPGGIPQTRAALNAYSRLPLSFTANQGQADPGIGFITSCNGYSIALPRDRAEMTLRPNVGGQGSKDVLRMRLLEAADHGKVSAENSYQERPTSSSARIEPSGTPTYPLTQGCATTPYTRASTWCSMGTGSSLNTTS